MTKRLFGVVKGHREHIADHTGRLYSDSEVADLLNTVYEENEQLKQSNKDAWNLIRFIYNEIKEDGYMDFGRIKDLVEFE